MSSCWLTAVDFWLHVVSPMDVHILKHQVIIMDTKRLTAMTRAIKAEKELCTQDIAMFKKWQDSVKARKSKSWLMLASSSWKFLCWWNKCYCNCLNSDLAGRSKIKTAFKSFDNSIRTSPRGFSGSSWKDYQYSIVTPKRV